MLTQKHESKPKHAADIQFYHKYNHVVPVWSSLRRKVYFMHWGITDARSLVGLRRYIIENNCQPISHTLQGNAYSGIDLLTGRRVILKCANKHLVQSKKTKNGLRTVENIQREKNHLIYVSNNKRTHPGLCKFVDFFETGDDYFLVTENGGMNFLRYINKNHPIQAYQRALVSKNVKYSETTLREAIKSWKQCMRVQFSIIAGAVYKLHVDCKTAHLDLSLENTVIDGICRIIDFGFARSYRGCNSDSNNGLDCKFKGCFGKYPYMAPEIQNIRLYLKKCKENNKTVDINTIPEYLAYDPRGADVWSLGVMLFTMLTGYLPFINGQIPENIGAFEYAVQRLKKYNSMILVETDALDLLKQIFVPASKRIDIKHVLDHKYVKSGMSLLRNRCQTNDE